MSINSIIDPKLNKARKRAKRLLLVVVVLGIVTAIAVAVSPHPKLADAGAQVSCGHFKNVVGDISQGLLTDKQGHAKFEQVYATAKTSSVQAVAQGAKDMLAADVSGDSSALAIAMTNFSNACTTAGY